MNLCVCGVNCNTCPHLSDHCEGGCEALEGKVWWTSYIEADVCPVYGCVKEKQYGNCGDCEELPCNLWVTLKDPSHTDEQHQKSIEERTDALKKLRINE